MRVSKRVLDGIVVNVFVQAIVIDIKCKYYCVFADGNVFSENEEKWNTSFLLVVIEIGGITTKCFHVDGIAAYARFQCISVCLSVCVFASNFIVGNIIDVIFNSFCFEEKV